MQVHTVTLANTHSAAHCVFFHWHIKTGTDKSFSSMLWYYITHTLELNVHRPTSSVHKCIPQLDDTIWWLIVLLFVFPLVLLCVLVCDVPSILCLIFYAPLCTCTAGPRFCINFCISAAYTHAWEKCFIFPCPNVYVPIFMHLCLAIDSSFPLMFMYAWVWIMWNIISIEFWQCCTVSSLPCVCVFMPFWTPHRSITVMTDYF